MDENIKELIIRCRNSNFNRDNYSVSVEFKRFVNSMLLHTWYDITDIGRYDVNVDNSAWLKRVTPEFQRDNNKWTKNMKTKFIENILQGSKTELMLFRMDIYGDAQIIDGLQRTTAIIDFFNGKIKPFGYSIKELEPVLRSFNTGITIRIYTFDNWRDVGKFYVDMNENITHSKKDIDKAKKWFLESHGIEL